MQTFITRHEIGETAKDLDDKRLVKQYLEGRQILDVLAKPEYREDGRLTPWAHHPAVLMWRGFGLYLIDYYLEPMRQEICRRGFRSEKNDAVIAAHRQRLVESAGNVRQPWWIANTAALDRVVCSHREALFGKKPDYYGMWSRTRALTCCPDCNYYWPSHIVDRKAGKR